MYESKRWNWHQGSVRHEQDIIKIMLEEDQQTEATNTQNEEPTEHNVRRSTRTRTESTRLTRYEIFPYQTIDALNSISDGTNIVHDVGTTGLTC